MDMDSFAAGFNSSDRSAGGAKGNVGFTEYFYQNDRFQCKYRLLINSQFKRKTMKNKWIYKIAVVLFSRLYHNKL